MTLAAEEAKHLRDVLRLKAGDEVSVFDGEGREFLCVIEESGRKQSGATLAVRSEVAPASPSSPLHLTLALALLKGEKFDLVVQKATELGAAYIVPVVTARADVRVRDEQDGARRRARWQRLALEACKQSGRASVPVVDAPLPLAAVVEREPLAADERRMMFAERGGEGLLETLNRHPVRATHAAALVGPEGGWTDEEISHARTNGWQIITLGGRILRAETAAITATALLQHLFGDLV